jgi:hypothetical protein
MADATTFTSYFYHCLSDNSNTFATECVHGFTARTCDIDLFLSAQLAYHAWRHTSVEMPCGGEASQYWLKLPGGGTGIQ